MPVFADSALPDYFGTMLLALVIVYVLAQALFALAYRINDWATPGNLGQELLGSPATLDAPAKAPNVALALVVSSMNIGMAIVLGCAIIGILNH